MARLVVDVLAIVGGWFLLAVAAAGVFAAVRAVVCPNCLTDTDDCGYCSGCGRVVRT